MRAYVVPSFWSASAQHTKNMQKDENRGSKPADLSASYFRYLDIEARNVEKLTLGSLSNSSCFEELLDP